jgi:hypothetical protein
MGYALEANSLYTLAVIVNWPHFSPGESFAQLTITEMASLKYLDKSHFIAGTGNLDNSILTIKFLIICRD